MAYGDNITEGLPYPLSNPNSVKTYQISGEAYDLSINGQPFFMYTTDETPYRRQTAPYRKDQVDQSNEPGEQSLSGWWLRSQSSFHNGEGIKFYDPSAGEIVQHRFADSKGVDVWTKGQATLLKSCTAGHVTTGAIASNGTSQQHLRSIKWGTFTGALLRDDYDVDKIKVTDPSNPIHFIDYNSGADSPVYAICDDGTFAYWITNTATKKTVYKKALTLTSTDADTKMFDEIGTVSNATMEYVKDRIILCADNRVYEFPTSATAMPSPVYTQATSTHVYTSITASGPAIYLAGYNGSQSTIQKFTLSTAGVMPTLTSAIVAAELPVGEIVHKIYYYLGYMMIGTNKGVRAAIVSDQDGSINYGPLIVETTQPCYDFAARDTFIWCATSVDGEPGLIRINLAQELEPLRFAYANDVYYPGTTGHVTTAVCFDGNTDPATTDRLMFATAYASSANGAIYVESASTLISSGYVTTGKIRYATLEDKVFKVIKTRVANTYGSFNIKSIDSNNNEYSIGNFNAGDFTPEVNVTYPVNAQEYMSFKFTLTRHTTDSTKGPTFLGYQLKALPAVPRKRLIQYPLALFDNEKDKNGVQIGYDGSAYERLSALETIESAGDSIRVDDFRTGESYVGLIEEINFINRTPTDKRFPGFGGILLVTIRSL